MVVILFVVVLFILLASRIHIAVGLGMTGIILLLIYHGIPMQVINQSVFKSVDSYPLAAIPFFILLGEGIQKGKLAPYVMDLINLFLRRFRGGLAVATILTSVFFAAVSGSSVASAAALGRNVTDILEEEKYPKRFAAGLVAVGATLGIMIPPSLSFIIIGTMVGLPIVTLFTAGILPGLVEATGLAIVAYYLSRKNQWGIVAKENISIAAVGRLTGRASPILFTPFLILGGIYLGWFTPTEVAAVAAGYCLFIGFFLYRSLSVRDVGSSLKGALYSSGMIYFIIIGGNLLAFMLTRLGVTQMMVEAVQKAGLQPWQFLLIVNIILLGLGCVLDGISICILSIPILFPMAKAVGVDLIHFSVVMTANIEIATLTPPIGLNLFVMSGVTGLPVHEVVRGVTPFFAMRFFMLMVITYVPWLSLILPSLGGYM